jgi:predicted phage tail protein
MAFTEDNIIKGTFNYGYGKVENTPNKLAVEWFAALEYKNPKRISWAEDELNQEIYGIHEEKIEALGIIRQSQANRLAKKIMYERKLNDVWCEFEANIESMHCEVFDIVSVTHQYPDWTAALFRIAEVTETNFGNAKFLCQAYNSSILDDGYGSTFSDWDYGSPSNPYEAVTDVTNIALAEVGWLNNDGVWVTNIDVTWTSPATRLELLRSYFIELKKGAADYVPAGIALASATSFRISGNIETGVTYLVRIKTNSVNGIVSNGAVSNAINIVGKTTSPGNVANFRYTWLKNLELYWDNVTDYDLVGYEIRDENANFGVDDTHLIYRGLTNKKILIPTTRTPGSYYIRAINATRYYSPVSAFIVPENKAPEIPLSFNAYIAFNMAQLEWTDDLATDTEYYEVYVSKTNAWAGEETLLARVPGKRCTIQSESSQNGMSDDDGSANTNYVTDLDLTGWGPDYWKGSYIEIISGTGIGQQLKITAYDTVLGKFTVDGNWTTKPDTTSKFFIHPVRYCKVRGVDGFGPGSFTSAIELKFTEFTEGMLSDQIISARKLIAGEVVTLSAQIRNAIINNAHIIDLSADKVTAGTITVAVGIGSNRIVLDGANGVIKIYDNSNNLMVELGALS